MKCSRAVLITVLTLFLCLFISTSGCNVSKERTVLSMLSYVPKDAESFDFQDVTAMKENDEIDRFYSNLEGDLWEFLRLEEISGGIIDEKQYEKYGIYSNDVDYSLCLRGNYYILIIKGNLNFDQIIQELNTIGLETSEHLGVVIWKGYSVSIVLTEDLIIMGNGEDIRDCIEVIKGENNSILENQEIMGLVDRLEGSSQVVCGIFEPAEDSFFGEDICGFGKSAHMLGENNIRISYVYLCVDEDIAQYALDSLENTIEAGEVNEDISIIDAYCDGRYYVMTFETEDWLYYYW